MDSIRKNAVIPGLVFLLLLFSAIIFTANTGKSPELMKGLAFADAKKMYVSSDAGLKLRETPGTNGKIVRVMEKWELMDVLEVSPKDEVIGGAKGRWIKVKRSYDTGWAFSAFLSEYSPAGKDLQIIEALKKIKIEIEGSESGYPHPASNDEDGTIRGSGGGSCGDFAINDTVVKDGRVYFGFTETYFLGPDGKRNEDLIEEDYCGGTKVDASYECWIEGDPILKTATGGTLNTTSKCRNLKKQSTKVKKPE